MSSVLKYDPKQQENDVNTTIDDVFIIHGRCYKFAVCKLKNVKILFVVSIMQQKFV